jgi:hypothetical protein
MNQASIDPVAHIQGIENTIEHYKNLQIFSILSALPLITKNLPEMGWQKNCDRDLSALLVK